MFEATVAAVLAARATVPAACAAVFKISCAVVAIVEMRALFCAAAYAAKPRAATPTTAATVTRIFPSAPELSIRFRTNPMIGVMVLVRMRRAGSKRYPTDSPISSNSFFMMAKGEAISSAAPPVRSMTACRIS